MCRAMGRVVMVALSEMRDLVEESLTLLAILQIRLLNHKTFRNTGKSLTSRANLVVKPQSLPRTRHIGVNTGRESVLTRHYVCS